MRNLHVVVICISLLMMLSAAACGAQSGSTQDGSEHTQTAHLTGSAKDFERARFDAPTHIDNRWLPLTPGTQFVYEGPAIVDEGERQPRRVVTTVTDLTKVIDGVRVLVIWETDYTAGKLSEPELAFLRRTPPGTCGWSASTQRSTRTANSTKPRPGSAAKKVPERGSPCRQTRG